MHASRRGEIVIGPGKGLLLGLCASIVLLSALGAVLAVVYQGNTNIDMRFTRILNVSEPIGLNDLVNKRFVDNQTRPIYRGVTGSEDGNLGGYYGANLRCHGNFSGSHMCTVEEMIRSARNTSYSSGWVNCDASAPEAGGATEGVCYGSADSLSLTSSNSGSAPCSDWGSASSSLSGWIFSGTTLSEQGCAGTAGIHCCS